MNGQGLGYQKEYQNDNLYKLYYDTCKCNYDKFIERSLKKGFSEFEADKWYEHRNDGEK